MSWANPEFFWLLLLLPAYLGYYVWRWVKTRESALLFSSINKLESVSTGYRVWLSRSTPFLHAIAFSLFIIALARPQLQNTTVERSTEGIDIVISLDISSSMLAEDIKPNRLIASKEVAAEFIDRRLSDRIGINVFARESFTVVPPTLDYSLLKSMLETVDLGMVRDGTAIGMGIATAVNRLRDSEAESKIIILLTDGMNNAGEIDPITAGEIAASYGIKIYTVGIGSRGTAPYPIDDPIFGRRYQNVQVNIDEEMLQQISRQTGGRYWRATDLDEYTEVYQEIDRLERSEIEEITYVDYQDLYFNYLLGGLFFLIVAFVNERFLVRSPLFQP